jgi:hypothetical protein
VNNAILDKSGVNYKLFAADHCRYRQKDKEKTASQGSGLIISKLLKKSVEGLRRKSMIDAGLFAANVTLAVKVFILVSVLIENFIAVLALVPVIFFIGGPLGLGSVAVSLTLGSGANRAGLGCCAGCSRPLV